MTSPFLRLPRELRDEIYYIFFNSTRLSYGMYFKEVGNTKETKLLKPARNSLAILQTCHQINAETRNVWLGGVTFRFDNAKVCMEKLSKLPQEVISKMRHLAIFDHEIMYDGPAQNSSHRHATCYLTAILRLFPTLRLDHLTVLQEKCCDGTYVRNFILNGSGWRKLTVVYQTWGSWLADEENSFMIMKERIDSWQSDLWTRDGYNSGSTIESYVSLALDQHSTVKAVHNDPTPIDQKIIRAKMTNDQLAKMDVRFVVKRGKNVDMGPTANRVLHHTEPLNDIVDAKNRLGWNGFLDLCRVKCLGDENTFIGEEHDEYVDVDEFRWHNKRILTVES